MSGASKFSCPSNGTFYACDYGERFLGCCSNENADDTCTNGCPQSGLRAASFPKEDYDNTPVNSCTSGQWWTCADTSPPFLGCCKSNPCLAAGCPMGDLTAAVLSTLDADKAPYSPIQAPVSRSTSSSAASASSASASVSAASTPSSLGVQPTTTSTSSHKIPSGAVAGGVVGGVLGVGFLVGILICYRRRKARRGSGTDENGRENGRGLIGMVLSCFRKNDLGANGTGKTEKEGVEGTFNLPINNHAHYRD